MVNTGNGSVGPIMTHYMVELPRRYLSYLKDIGKVERSRRLWKDVAIINIIIKLIQSKYQINYKLWDKW